MPLVSVIIPTYNRSHTILNAINSVLSQTFQDFEVLICDDGSTDNTKEIINTINDDRVKYIDCGRNGRPAIPRNIGIKNATSEWLAFLDSDDEWLPEKLEKQLQMLNKSKLKACSNNAFYRRNNEITNIKINDTTKEIFTIDDLLECNFVICSSSLVHRSLFEVVKGFPEEKELKALEDYSLWLRIVSITNFCYINEPLVIYNDEPNTSVRNEQKYTNYKDQKKVILKNLKKWNKKYNFDKIFEKKIKTELRKY